MPLADLLAIFMPGLIGIGCFFWLASQVFRKERVETLPQQRTIRHTVATPMDTRQSKAIWY